MENILIGDYFLHNYTSKNLGFFLANENEDNYYNFISLIIRNIEEIISDNNINNDYKENYLMCYMKLLLNILYNTDDRKNRNISLLIKCIINVFNFSKVKYL